MARRKSNKFIPDRDLDFAVMAARFVRAIARDPARFNRSADDLEQIAGVINAYRLALVHATRKATRTELTIHLKDQARKPAEAIVRRFANIIRADDRLSPIDKMAVGIRQRPRTLGKRPCPMTPPVMIFAGSTRGTSDAGRNGGVHILKFHDTLGDGTRAKPAGAERLELFVELIAPDEPVPAHPGQLSGGRPWYLRSFTRSPMRVEFPMPAAPMLVVYWGRWADRMGNVGPWSQTLTACVEGWPNPVALPDGSMNDTNRRITVTIARHALTDQTRAIEAPALPAPI